MNSTELILTIQEAFQDVKLEDGVSLNMTEYNDSGGYKAEHYKQLAVDDERDDWQKIDDETLEKFTVTFCFTDWKGFRFYIPAYMTWAIKHPESNCVIGDFTIYALDPSSISKKNERPFDKILNKQQIEAIVLFLEHCIENDDRCDAKSAATNLKRMKKYL
jgi:hypothetical protein